MGKIMKKGVLLHDIRRMIEETRSSVATMVNAGLTMLYWQIGKRINEEILKGGRAEYGEEIVSTLSRQLEIEFGRGFGKRNLFRMIRFAEVFPDPKIVSALLTQLSWTHFLQVIPFDDPLKRDFYAEMCRIERWSTRTLVQKIGGMLFERTALSKKPERLIRTELSKLRDEDRLTPELVFRDPYFLDFLGLKGAYQEKDLEAAPVGLILCAGKKHETVELLELEKSGIRVAEYLTELPPRKVLEEKLHKAVEHARHRFENLTTQKGL